MWRANSHYRCFIFRSSNSKRSAPRVFLTELIPHPLQHSAIPAASGSPWPDAASGIEGAISNGRCNNRDRPHSACHHRNGHFPSWGACGCYPIFPLIPASPNSCSRCVDVGDLRPSDRNRRILTDLLDFRCAAQHRLVRGRTARLVWHVYFAAETYSSLGFVDIMPHGALRLIVAIGSINGILLLAWSGAFLFAFAERIQANRIP